MRHIPEKNLHVSTPTWWLESRFHFSFAEYYNPQNAEFGVLRVLNDDLVKPKSGFGTHPHRDMEIFTYIVEGKLTHKDSIGTSESLGRGAVQYMSAGTGIRHSEMNNGQEMLRFLQIWIKPNRSGLKPNYGSRVWKQEDRHNKIQHVVTSFDKYASDKDLGEGVIPINQDCNIFVSEADPGVEQEYVLSANRQLYMVCIEGQLNASDLLQLEARDAVEIKAKKDEDLTLALKADKTAGAHFLMIEMALA
jgi:redox-sensitive bicupin YhaK (pirin superfamily)